MTVLLSTTSQDLIAKLSEKDKSLMQPFQQTAIDRASLLKWLEQSSSVGGNEATFFLLTSLQASLLNDLNASLNPNVNKKEKSGKGGKAAKAKLALLALAGTIYFGCEGFDGVTSVMGVFSSVPTIAFFTAGTLFSILSIVVFFSFDLVEISKNLGVKPSEAPKLLDVLLDEFKQIKLLRARLSKSANKSLSELEEDLAIAKMLLKRHEDLDKARTQLKLALENPYLKAGKMITAAVAGVIFFSGGFFAGQTVALAISSLFVATMTATAWPIVAASIVVGLAAFAVYWYVERPGIENLIRRWRGLDKEKMDQLCKSKVVDRETDKLQNLIEGIEEKIALHRINTTAQSQVQKLEGEISSLKQQLGAKTLPKVQPHAAQADNDELIEKKNVKVKVFDSLKGEKSSSHIQYSLFKLKDCKTSVDPMPHATMHVHEAHHN